MLRVKFGFCMCESHTNIALTFFKISITKGLAESSRSHGCQSCLKDGKWFGKRVACHFLPFKRLHVQIFLERKKNATKKRKHCLNHEIDPFWECISAIWMVQIFVWWRAGTYEEKKSIICFAFAICLYLNNFKITVLNIEITIKTLIMQMDVCSNISLYCLISYIMLLYWILCLCFSIFGTKKLNFCWINSVPTQMAQHNVQLVVIRISSRWYTWST